MPIGTRPFKATVYSPDVRTSAKGNPYTKCKLRTAKKNRDGSWENEYWQAIVFAALGEKDRIEITEFSLEQRKYESGGQQRFAYDMTVWNFNPIEVAPAPGAENQAHQEVEDDSSELPF